MAKQALLQCEDVAQFKRTAPFALSGHRRTTSHALLPSKPVIPRAISRTSTKAAKKSVAPAEKPVAAS